MHLGRFTSVVRETREYFDRISFAATVDRAIAQLQPYISNRSASNLQAFRSILDELQTAALATPSSFELPSVVAIHSDLHIEQWIGQRLYHELAVAVSSPGLLPEEIIEQLQKITAEWTGAVRDISQLDEILARRRVECTDLLPDQAELGLGFPKEVVGETAKDLSDELEHVSRLFAAFDELRGAGNKSPKLRTISSSWWQFFLELDAVQIAAWTVALERIVALLKTNYEIKKLALDLEAKQHLLPEGIVEQINERISTNIKMGVGELAQELRKAHQKLEDDARANELETQLRMELSHLVRRINQGGSPGDSIGRLRGGADRGRRSARRPGRYTHRSRCNERKARESVVSDHGN